MTCYYIVNILSQILIILINKIFIKLINKDTFIFEFEIYIFKNK